MVWSPGQLVRHIDDAAKQGTVTDQVRDRASGQQIRVNWNGRFDWHFEDELVSADIDSFDVVELIKEGRFGRIDDLKNLMTHVYLTGRLSNVIYAMGLTQTDFYPHQYKPLLTLLDSPVNGLLIADEVGLGKTIEAGLIWTELRARYDMKRLLIVCPAMLREKWQHELSVRFGIEASCVNAQELFNELKQSERREKALIVSYQGVRIPNDWSINDQGRPGRRETDKLADFLYQHSEGDPIFDLVIFDEAHYMRNQNTGAWKTGNLLKDVSAYQLMLSATPINLGSEDLFNMLRLLDPDHFGHSEDFDRVLLENTPVVRASDIVRNPRTNASQIIEALENIKSSLWYQSSDRLTRLVEEVRGVSDWSESKRVDIAAKLERFNLLSHLVSRTRKREVQQERVMRQADIFQAVMTPLESQLYQAVTDGTRDYAEANNIKHGFLLSTPQRMVSSSPVALLQSWAQTKAFERDTFEFLSDESDEDDDEIVQKSSGIRSFLAGRALTEFSVSDLQENDSKFDLFLQQISKFLLEDPHAKAIVFSTFRGTAKYLVERLKINGINSSLLMGGAGFDKDAIVSEFKTIEHQRLMVCTDVASEGVDLQFCRLIVNYDLPWNPMRIEQRIGRIDRIGQQSKRILIWNFVYKDTIDARILSRLTSRIGVFESTFGETEAILGQVRKLEDILLSRGLTSEEETQLIDEVALAIETVRQKQEELEQEAVQLVAHGQQLLEQIEASRNSGNIIGKDDLINYVANFVNNSQGCRMVPVVGKSDEFEICLHPQIAAELDDFLRSKNLLGKTNLHTGQLRKCIFSEKITGKQSFNHEVIHRFHPLIQFVSARKESSDNGSAFPLYACKLPFHEVVDGHYLVMARIASFSGIKDDETVLVAAYDLYTNRTIAHDIAQTMFNKARQQGNEWVSVQVDVDSQKAASAAEQLEDELKRQYQSLKREKQNDNIDRTEVLLRLAQEHLHKKSTRFHERIANHEFAASMATSVPQAQKRKALASAERKKMADFIARIETKIANIERKRESFVSDCRDICTLVVKVSKDA